MNRLSKKNFELLMGSQAKALVIMPDGEVKNGFGALKNSRIDVVSGSFNPLHNGHKLIMSICKNVFGLPYAEISVERADKEDLSFEEINRRIDQFAWFSPVIITRARLFLEKTAVLHRNLTRGTCVAFHVGADTFIRSIRHYGIGIEALKCEFVVHPRYVNDALMGPAQLRQFCQETLQLHPVNVYYAPVSKRDQADATYKVSSTEMRERKE